MADDRKQCLKCGKPRPLRDFYKSNSTNHLDSKYPVCKSCIKNNLNIKEDTDLFNNEFLDVLNNTLLEMNRPFIYSVWVSSVEEHKRRNNDLFGLYIKNINLNSKTKSWKDSEFNAPKVESQAIEIIDKPIDEEVKVVDHRDRDDVVRMLGYDPFEYESDQDKKQLYNRLIDFLDESALEDGFKLQAVIEIVKGFNQIDKINQAITTITNDITNLSTNAGGITTLINSKKNILASLLKLAEDNGLSVKHNNQKSKGAGTLSGIIKTLHEKGIESADINVYDIETCEGMRQVADISNKSIMDQLMLNESDYSEMINDQRQMILNYEKKLADLEEENRIIKIKLNHYEKFESEIDS